MPTVIKIRNWKTIYEISDAKRATTGRPLPWVAIPTKHDGRGFRRLMRRPDGLVLFAAFILMVEIAGKSPERGALISEDGPLTPDDLSDSTGAPVLAFEIAIQVLSLPEFGINWLEIVGDTPTYFRVGSATYVTIRDETDVRTNETNETRRNGTGRDETKRRAASAARITDHQKLIDYFCAQWAKKYHAKYFFQRGKDGAHAKWILEQVGIDAALAGVDVYLADDESFLVADRHSFGLFKSQLRRFTIPAPTKSNGEIDLSFKEVEEEHP